MLFGKILCALSAFVVRSPNSPQRHKGHKEDATRGNNALVKRGARSIIKAVVHNYYE
jgi:hypothetical protein